MTEQNPPRRMSRPSITPFQEKEEHVWLKNTLWWKKGIVYQIYPRSYQDSNGDGVGDLKGIISRLDYIQSLNVTAIWLSPIFPSPMEDFGYDVANYTDVHPLFGNIDDFCLLLVEVHKRGMRLLLDLVPNHTSSQHPWFLESKTSRDNPKRDYYFWRDPAPDGGPPNNWLSHFGGPAWTFDEHTGQYYLHQFAKGQPELNYRHPEVLPAMMDNIRFWLDLGVDGFRVDVIWLLLKDEMLRDEPKNPMWTGANPFEEFLHIHTQNVDGIHELIKKFREVFDSYEDRMMVGEIYLPYEELMKYYGHELDECHLPFNFKLIQHDWRAADVRHFIKEYEDMLPEGCWPNWVLGNHDQHRVGTRIGKAQMRVANTMLLTLRGTPTSYYGEEIGMTDAEIPFSKMQDPPALLQPDRAHIVGRDFERSPMQWEGTRPNAGFCEEGVESWLPLAKDWRGVNVQNQEKDPKSMLTLYRKLSDLRRREPALSVGNFYALSFGNKDADDSILCYRREADENLTYKNGAQITTKNGSQLETVAEEEEEENSDLSKDEVPFELPHNFLVVLNFTDKDFPHLNILEDLTSGNTTFGKHALIDISTELDREGKIELADFSLRPNEGLVIRLKAK